MTKDLLVYSISSSFSKFTTRDLQPEADDTGLMKNILRSLLKLVVAPANSSYCCGMTQHGEASWISSTIPIHTHIKQLCIRTYTIEDITYNSIYVPWHKVPLGTKYFCIVDSTNFGYILVW